MNAMSYELYDEIEEILSPFANYLKIKEVYINPSPITLGITTIYPGDKITYIGKGAKSGVRTFEMQRGHYLEYVGIFEHEHPRILFASDGEVIDDIYYQFYLIDTDTLLLLTNHGQSATNINVDVIKFYEELEE